jgi:2-phosphosulfolactate phosphatase
MRIEQATRETCGDATGAVVAIDVIRAFTTAAFAFAAGARDIVLVSTVEEAFALRERFPGALAMGEVDGLPIAGFEFGNSPGDLMGHDLSERRLIQRTSAGTQGMVLSSKAELLLAASFVCAGATARFLQRAGAEQVTFVITGIHPTRDGDEDAACAEYIACLLRGEQPDPAPFLQRIYTSDSGLMFVDATQLEFAPEDLEYCAALDRFDFAMLAERQDGLLIMRPIPA